ncbi:sugar transferase [Mucilaginibacter sp.]|uniref:sugar transferase n=1 Tax=Mucilaginibacter sp. TaxID=1882438 RepID=UPI00261EA4E2|nr:sugar transferase [Mucilaginibacter sp.]
MINIGGLKMIIKRIFDIVFALASIFLLTPLFFLIAVFITLNSNGGIFYMQNRVGKNGCVFKLFKFRTMFINSDHLGLLTIGNHDHRITPVGYWLRKFKLDELPQLFNVLIGDMSFVGPRPEVNKYVKLYNETQLRVLSVKPGITDWASIQYFNENELLAHSDDPEKFYIDEIIPSKIIQNLGYIDRRSFWMDIKIMLYTLKRLIN